MQKAVFVYEVGKPVRLGEREIPSPKAGELLVKVTAAQVLPHDAYGRDRGVFIGEKLPWVLGSSMAGIVHQLGSNPSPVFNVGHRVFGTSNLQYSTPDQAGLQEHAILQTPRRRHQYRPPLHPPRHPHPWSQTIIAVASLSNTSELQEAGASHIIDRHLPLEALIAQIQTAAGGSSNVTRILDCASCEHSLATALLAPDKPTRLVTLHRVNEDKIREMRPLCRATLVQNTNANLGGHAEALWKVLPEWIEAGVVRPTTFWTLDGLGDVDAINGQLDEYSAGKGLVQLVVRP